MGRRAHLRLAAAVPPAGPRLRTQARSPRGHGVLGHHHDHDKAPGQIRNRNSPGQTVGRRPQPSLTETRSTGRMTTFIYRLSAAVRYADRRVEGAIGCPARGNRLVGDVKDGGLTATGVPSDTVIVRLVAQVGITSRPRPARTRQAQAAPRPETRAGQDHPPPSPRFAVSGLLGNDSELW